MRDVTQELRAENLRLNEIITRLGMATKAACIGSANPPTATAVLMSEQSRHLCEIANSELRAELAAARKATGNQLHQCILYKRDSERGRALYQQEFLRAEKAEAEHATMTAERDEWRKVAEGLAEELQDTNGRSNIEPRDALAAFERVKGDK